MQVKATSSMLPDIQSAAPAAGQTSSVSANNGGANLPATGAPLPAPSSHTSSPAGRGSESAQFSAALQKLKAVVKQTVPGLTLTAGLQSGYVVAKLVDPQTKKVLLELPPVQVIKLAQHPEQLSGLLVQAKA